MNGTFDRWFFVFTCFKREEEEITCGELQNAVFLIRGHGTMYDYTYIHRSYSHGDVHTKGSCLCMAKDRQTWQTRIRHTMQLENRAKSPLQPSIPPWSQSALYFVGWSALAQIHMPWIGTNRGPRSPYWNLAKRPGGHQSIPDSARSPWPKKSYSFQLKGAKMR